MKDFSSNQQRIKQWRDTLTQCLRDANKKKVMDNTQYIKLHKTEKSILSFQITKSRTAVLKEIFKTTKTLTIGDETVETKNIGFSHASGDSNEIECLQLTALLKKEFSLKDTINRVIEKEYKLFLLKLETEWVSFLEIIIHFVGKLDVLVCRAYNAMENHYSCPVLRSNNEGDQTISQVKTTGLRHILIEHLLTNETYTPNDIELSDDPQGILLFGINSSGKTSLLRSLGIAVILAQSGNFVPATTFEYTPYRSIYSRIVGTDNLFKGHSSFAVEMTELRVILRMADKHSLVLADEISKGSEMDSAISITTAALMNFVALKCSFMITSHLHEIVDYDEIKAMSKQLHLKHLLVSFDYEKDTLVYDRKLKDGSGESFYGLLVCKSLHLPQSFIEQAYKIRQKYLVKDKGILSQKTSIYNAKKIRGMCEQCGQNPSDETHHIMPQKLADANGFFPNGLHMNHVANLSALCSSCHDTIHSCVSKTEYVGCDTASVVTEDSLIKKKKIKIIRRLPK
jgi:DNA mismatch repair protein MutS